jgi:hypothetical protein
MIFNIFLICFSFLNFSNSFILKTQLISPPRRDCKTCTHFIYSDDPLFNNSTQFGCCKLSYNTDKANNQKKYEYAKHIRKYYCGEDARYYKINENI